MKCLNNKLFWSSSVNWRMLDDMLQIEAYIYSSYYTRLFPKLYFLTQNGIMEEELIVSFSELDIDVERLKIFIEDLKEKRILVDSILSPSELFYPQNRLLEHGYGESLIIDNNKLEGFRKEQLNRSNYENNSHFIQLEFNEMIPDFISRRRSYRDFNIQKLISFEDFSYLASVYSQNIKEKNKIQYNYASAGGLYPIDIYYYIKENRVEKIKAGIYYYNPSNSTLILVDDKFRLNKEVHYYANQNIFSKSAFSIFYFYYAEASMPKYGGLGYYYSLIDLGIMIEAYTCAAEMKNIGVCSIGEMNFDSIEDNFKLKKNQVYLHTLEVGII